MSEICLKTCELCLGYGKSAIIDGMNVEIKVGRITALLGANGCGKSTLLNGLAGQLPPMNGRVLLHGETIHSQAPKTIARQIAVLAQQSDTPGDMSVFQLVKLGRYPHLAVFGRWSARDEEACRAALRLTAMEDLADKALDALSGGQRQRAWISLALAQQTDILLLDEPTTYLDLAHQMEIMEMVQTLVRDHGKTVVAVLHDLNQAARYADEIILLRQGRVIAHGSPEYVINPENVEAAYGVSVSCVKDDATGETYYNPRSIAAKQLGTSPMER